MSDIFETDIDDEAENLASLEDGDVGIAPTEKIVFDYPLYHLKLEYSCETIYAKTPEKMELKPGDFVIGLFETTTQDSVLVFTNLGNYCY